MAQFEAQMSQLKVQMCRFLVQMGQLEVHIGQLGGPSIFSQAEFEALPAVLRPSQLGPEALLVASEALSAASETPLAAFVAHLAASSPPSCFGSPR